MKSIVSELIIGVGLSIIYDNKHYSLRFYFDEEQNLILLLLLLLVVVVVVVVWNNILK
jgi:ABC-type sugar transport system permease subunit